MTPSSRASRIALFVMVAGAIVWLGGVNIRAMIANDMLKTGTLEFEEYLAPEAEREIFRLMSFASVITMISYAAVLVSGSVYLATTSLRFREHGWLMMSAILFYAFVPVEIFTMTLDVRMVYLEFFTTAGNDVFRELFIARVAALAGAPVIALLCYYTIIALAVFRPFTRAVPADS